MPTPMLAHLLLDLLQVPDAAFGRRVAAVHEAVDADVFDALALRHLEQRIQVGELRMHAAVAAAVPAVQAARARRDASRASSTGSRKKSPDAIIRSMRVTSISTTRPAPMFRWPDFAVAHLALGQPDGRARGVDQRVREIAQQPVVGGLARGGDRIAFDGRRKAPAIENRQDQRFRSRACRHLACAECLACPANLRGGRRARSSMRSSWLYFAMRSVRLAEPVLIWPAPVATARSAINGSSVSPERCETTAV